MWGLREHVMLCYVLFRSVYRTSANIFKGQFLNICFLYDILIDKIIPIFAHTFYHS